MFEVGDKLVCILGGSPTNGNTSEKPLVEGAIYVVQTWDPPRWSGDSWGVRVLGNRTFYMDGGETFWNAERRFRKLSDMQQEARERKTQKQPKTIPT
jgi:hypothetical protein